MNRMSRKSILYTVTLIILFLSSCSYDFPSAPEKPEVDLGSLNIDRLTVLGSSVSAGLMDGALYNRGQNSAYPSQFSTLIEEQTGEEIYFSIPIESETGFNVRVNNNTSSTPGKFFLSFRNPTQEWPAQLTVDGENIQDYEGALTDLSNFSIPGIKSFNFDDEGSLSGNPYFDRLTQKNSNESILDIALLANPTVMILEPGTEDIFGYSLDGASGDVDPATNNIQPGDLTPASVFDQEVDEMVDRILNESSADLFLVNIPDPFKFPYFTTLPWYYTSSEFEVVRNTFSFSYYSPFNLDVQEHNQTITNNSEYRPRIIFDVLGGNPFRAKVIEDEYLPDAQNNDGVEIPKYRQMTDEDYFLYNAEKLHYNSIENPPIFGTENPIEDQYIVTKTEAEIISNRREAFNDKIESIAQNNPRIHLVDFSGLIDRVYNDEVSYEGVYYSLGFDSKTIISADGFSLNAKGHALLTNELISVINQNFGANINLVDVNSRKGTNMEIGF